MRKKHLPRKFYVSRVFSRQAGNPVLGFKTRVNMYARLFLCLLAMTSISILSERRFASPTAKNTRIDACIRKIKF